MFNYYSAYNSQLNDSKRFREKSGLYTEDLQCALHY